MAQRSATLLAFRSMGTAAALWVVIGVPVAALIAALCVSVWVIASLADMSAVACILGAVQGLWLYLAGQRSESDYGALLWFGSLSGGFLGVLAFPAVLSSTSMIAARPTVAVFLMAAIVGGVAAGLASAHVLHLPLRGRSLTLGSRVTISGLLVIVLAAMDYRFFWPATAERVAASEVSRQEITSLSAGNARGSQWTGCYQYQGKTPLGMGGGSGLLKVAQTDGVLKVEDWSNSFLGGVDRNGRFRFGNEIAAGPQTLRTIWQGKFQGNSFEFERRMTVVNGVNALGTGPLTGTGQLIPCP